VVVQTLLSQQRKPREQGAGDFSDPVDAGCFWMICVVLDHVRVILCHSDKRFE
jgi:hypothetical protein